MQEEAEGPLYRRASFVDLDNGVWDYARMGDVEKISNILQSHGYQSIDMKDSVRHSFLFRNRNK